jgi:hypothetical protein
MAKLNEQVLEIKITEMLKDNEVQSLILDGETVSQLLAIIEELVGPKKMVEINLT